MSTKFWGGGSKLHLEYALEFREKGYNVFLIGNKKGILKEGIENGLKVFSVSGGNRAFLNPVKVKKLINFYKKNSIDTVVFSNSEDVKLGGISAKMANVSNIVYSRGLAVPIKNSFLNRYLFTNVLTHIVANSKETKKTVLKNLSNFLKEDKVKVIYHGIDIHHIDYDKKLKEISREPGKIILGNAGRLTEQKGQKYLIEVAKELKKRKLDFNLYIAGTGVMELEIKEMIKNNNLEKEVIMLGFVKDMEAFMNSIDVFLLSSIWEGFGYVIVEAMIKSKPVVAFNISSNPEIIDQNETGFIVNYDDVTMFADKAELLIKNGELRDKMGSLGKENVIKRFELKERITEFEEYLLK